LPPTGLHAPLVTPFDSEGRPDASALETLGHELLEEGARGLVALGTTGEPTSPDPAERATVLDVCARVAREHDALLTVGVGGGDTRTVERALADLADRPGVGAALVPVVPASRQAVETTGRLLAAVEHLDVPGRAVTAGGSPPGTALTPPVGGR
ncbi:hypothetical protein FNQ90_10280, partial [Streptomyces alkaliphilus]